MISGKVIVGNRLGRTIGFPTANIETPADKLFPMEGVYSVKVQIKNGHNSKQKDLSGFKNLTGQ
jgi:riboflavin kinase/FMN adenylyltransferase